MKKKKCNDGQQQMENVYASRKDPKQPQKTKKNIEKKLKPGQNGKLHKTNKKTRLISFDELTGRAVMQSLERCIRVGDNRDDEKEGQMRVAVSQ